MNDGLRNLGRANSRKLDRSEYNKNIVKEFETSNNLKPAANADNSASSEEDDEAIANVKNKKKTQLARRSSIVSSKSGVSTHQSAANGGDMQEQMKALMAMMAAS